jgi:hypothetical protein
MKGRKRGEKEGYNPEVRKVGIRVCPVHCTAGHCTRVGELLITTGSGGMGLTGALCLHQFFAF